MMCRIGIVAGEASGDILGASLIEDIKKRFPNIDIVGIGGEHLIKQGCHSLFDIQILSVVGITEAFSRGFKILKVRKQLINYFLNNPPDVFIGIDAPEFNLVLEERLRAKGIKVIHYVSPTVWAWRKYRLRQIARAVDLMLVLFPFELSYYQERNIAVRFVGHPLTKQINDNMNKHEARALLCLPADKTTVALMPGSRRHELKRHTPIFLKTALWLQQRHSDMCFVVNVINLEAKDILSNEIHHIAPQLNIEIFINDSIRVMQACDVLLLASGTITLEAIFLNKPMVVAYRLSWLSYQIVKYLYNAKYIALPNLLADKLLVPELIQNDCTPERLGNALLAWLNDPDAVSKLQQEFTAIHDAMLQHGNESATDAVLSFMK